MYYSPTPPSPPGGRGGVGPGRGSGGVSTVMEDFFGWNPPPVRGVTPPGVGGVPPPGRGGVVLGPRGGGDVGETPIYLNTGSRHLRTPGTDGNNRAEGGDVRSPKLDRKRQYLRRLSDRNAINELARLKFARDNGI